MAFTPPDVSQYLPDIQAPVFAKNAPPPEPEPSAYDTLTPAQKRRVDKRVDLAMNPRGALAEIGSQLIGGLVYDLPHMIGQSLKSTGKEGDTLYNVGQGINNLVSENETRFMPSDPEAHGAVTNALAGGARALAPSVVPMAAMLIPGVNVAAGAAIAGGVGATMFGAAQYQDTYEKAIEAGKSEAEAKTAALKTASIEGLGEGLGAAAGGVFLKGGSAAVRAMGLGRRMTTDEALVALQNPNFMKAFAKDFVKTASVEVGTEMGQNYGEAAVEKNAGIDTTDPWDAATQAFGPTLALSAFLGLPASVSLRHIQARNKALVDTVTGLNRPLDEVSTATKELADVMEPMVGKEAATEWRFQQLENANNPNGIAQRAAQASAAEDTSNLAQAHSEALARQAENEANQAWLDEETAKLNAPTPDVEQVTSERFRGLPTRGNPSYFSQFLQDDRPQIYPGEGRGVIAAASTWESLLREREQNQRAQQETQGDIASLLTYGTGPRLALPAPPARPTPTMSAKDRALAEKAQASYDKWLLFHSADLAYQQEQVTRQQQALSALRGPAADRLALPVPGQVLSLPAPTTPLSKIAMPDRRLDEHVAGLKSGERPAPAPAPATATEAAVETPATDTTAAKRTQATVQAQKAQAATEKVTAEAAYGVLETKASEAGIDTAKLKGQNAARLKRALAGSVNEKPEVQIERLKATAENMGKNTVARDALTAYIAHLETKNDEARVAAQNDQGSQPGSASVQNTAEVTGGRSQNGEGNAQAKPDGAQQGQGQGQVAQRPKLKSWSEGNYAFENTAYNPHVPPTFGQNRAWLLSYQDALDDINFKSDGGKELRKSKANVARANAALRAMAELELTEPEGASIHEVSAKRLAEFNQPMQARTALRETQREISETTKRQIRDEVATEGLLAKGKPVNETALAEYQLTPADQQKIVERYGMWMENDPRDDFDAASSPSYTVDPQLIEALKTGDLKAVLGYLKDNGPNEWIREIATKLERLGLNTKIRHILDRKFAPAEDSSLKSAQGARVFGRYNHRADAIHIYLGGENPHTVVHEIVHAATVGRMAEGLAAQKIPPWKRTASQRAAVADLQDLHAFYKEMKSLAETQGEKQYGFKNLAEFVAEAMSNEKFQKWLRAQEYDGRSGWQKFVDWIVNALGLRRTPGTMSAFEKAAQASFNFFEGSRFGTSAVMNLEHADSAGRATNETGQALVARWDQVLNAIPKARNAIDYLRKAGLQAATTFHITKTVEGSKNLAGMHDGIKKFSDADALKSVILDTKNRELLHVTKQAEMALGKYSKKEAEGWLDKMSRVVLEQSRFNVDARKSFDQNVAAGKKLDETQRKAINDLHSKYMQIPVELRHVMEDSVRALRKGYLQQTATFLANRINSYSKSLGGAAAGYAQELDFMRPEMKQGTLDANMRDFYGDIEAKNLHDRIMKVMDDVRSYNPNSPSASGGTTLGMEIEQLQQQFIQQVGNPYMHLGRSGDYFVGFTLKEKDQAGYEKLRDALEQKFGKVLGPPIGSNQNVFMRFENRTQADEAHRIVRELGGYEGDSLTKGAISDKGGVESVRGISVYMRNVLREIDNAEQDGSLTMEAARIMRKAALENYADTSSKTVSAARNQQGTPGYDADFIRSFAKRSEMMSSLLANTYTLPHFDDAFRSMKDAVREAEHGEHGVAAQAIHDEMRNRFANSLTPVDSPLIDGFKRFGYHMYLGLSPSFWAVNLVQPFQLTLPYLGGRYGFVQSFREMRSATAKAASMLHQTLKQGIGEGKKVGGLAGALRGALDLDFVLYNAKLSGGEKQFIHDLMASGQLSKMQSVELGQLASGDTGAKATALKLLSVGSQYTEVINRLTAGLAAYNLASKSSNPQVRANATKAGIDAVRETQYDYSDRNTGRAFGRHGVFGKVTPLAFSFQQYAFQTMELMLREMRAMKVGTPEERKAAMKSFGGMMATTSLLAGTMGLPLANVIAAVVDRILGSDDDPADVKSAYRKWLADVFGKDVAEAIARGVPRAALGFDLSGRTGMQNLLPGTGFIADRRAFKDQLEAGALNMMGPAVSAASSLATGLGMISDGRVLDGAIQMSPIALQGPLKAARLEEKGYTTSTANKLPMQATPWDTLVQGFGFTPSKKAEQSEVNFSARQRDTVLKREKASLSNAFYRAVEGGEDTKEVMKSIAEFNLKNPQYKIEPERALRLRAQERAIAGLSDTGIATLPKFAPLLERYKFANVN